MLYQVPYGTKNNKSKDLKALITDQDFIQMIKEVTSKVNTSLSVIEQVRKFILIDEEIKSINSGVLGDIAPTILDLIGVEQPKEMTQHSLL
mgnify:CR=1 FL=1